MSDPHTPRDPVRAKTARPSPWMREASVFVWLLLIIAIAVGLLFWL
jgi:hypothetical protein